MQKLPVTESYLLPEGEHLMGVSGNEDEHERSAELKQPIDCIERVMRQQSRLSDGRISDV